MVSDLINKFTNVLKLVRSDEFFGMPDEVRKEGRLDFLKKYSFVVFSDPYDYMAAETCRVLDGCNVLGVCADHLPPGCEAQKLLTAMDVYAIGKSRENVFAVMCADDPTYDSGLYKVAIKAGFKTIPHHLILRIADATTDLRNVDWLPTILNRSEEFLALVDRLNDDFSRLTVLNVLLTQMTGDHSYRRGIERPYHTLYFNTSLFSIRPDEIFVDCGASQGESITNLLRESGMQLRKSYEVEPDRFNVRKLEQLRLSLARHGLKNRIEIVPKAVGDQEGVVRFNHVGTHSGSISQDATDTVEITTIDQITGGVATLVKMDLEGYERPALVGARRTMQQSKPKLAISAYHRPDDLLEIPKMVLASQPDYKLGVQHHTFHRWDTCLYFY
jgi:FkbM family methyltransferase